MTSRVKIVSTIGPATARAEALKQLQNAGMSVARLNGSHGSQDWHRATIALIRSAAPGIPILLDIPGRKIRTTMLVKEPSFSAGDTVILTTDTAHDGSEKVPVNYDRLHEDLEAGNIIFADDGTLRFTVSAIQGRDIICRADTDGSLKSCKGINVPYVKLRRKLVTEKDHLMIAFAKANGVDFVGISFVESAEHIEEIRKIIGATAPKIVAKVENNGGMANVREIARTADVIMVDRGDLSVETELETVAVMQKEIIREARRFATPVIVATEMLHTMIENPYPTKAEVGDVTNAVLDGAAAVMLSGETAVGRYPIESVKLMRRVIDAACDMQIKSLPQGNPDWDIPDAVQEAAAAIARSLPVTKIVVITRSGYAARRLANCELRQPILAISDDAATATAFNMLPGTEGIFVDIEFRRTGSEHIPNCLHELWRRQRITSDDLLLVVSLVYPKTGNRMNLIELHNVADLSHTFGWTQPR